MDKLAGLLKSGPVFYADLLDVARFVGTDKNRRADFIEAAHAQNSPFFYDRDSKLY